MSGFSDGVTAPANGSQEPQTENYLADMVGEGKKYTTIDEAAQALAKKAVNADQFIETLKTEKQELETQYQELQTRNRSIDEIVNALKQPEPQAPAQQGQAPDIPDIDGLVDQKLKAYQEAESNAAKIRSTWDKLGSADVFGDIDKAKVAVAQYIGNDPVKKQLVDQMALADPEGLIVLLNKKQPVVTFSDNGSQRSTETTSDFQGKLTWDEADKIRKENPTLYYSQAFRKKMREEL